MTKDPNGKRGGAVRGDGGAMSQLMKTVIVIALLVIVAAAVIFVLCVSNENEDASETTLLPEALEEAEFSGTCCEWVDGLTGELKSAVNSAYESESSQSDGKLFDDWLATEVRAKFEGGEIVVTLPDGTEFAAEYAASAAGDEGAEESVGGSESDAASNPSITTLTVASVSAKAGQSSVAVPVEITNNAGILGLTAAISYNEAALELVCVENGEAVEDVLNLTVPQTFSTGCTFMWDGVEISDDQIDDGTLMTLYFDVLEEAEPGTHSIAIRVNGSAVDNNLNAIDVSVVGGGIDIE